MNRRTGTPGAGSTHGRVNITAVILSGETCDGANGAGGLAGERRTLLMSLLVFDVFEDHDTETNDSGLAPVDGNISAARTRRERRKASQRS